MPKVKCPTCGDAVAWSTSNPYRPFCSERCKNIDLGAWSTGQYGIAADPGPDQGEAQDEH
jgi:endogenous inhibitor of DNA gyrase (YacG/DUF329 family)